MVAEIRGAVRQDAAISVIPSVARPTAGAWYEGSDLAALANAADYLEVCFYEPTVDRVRADLQDVVHRCGGTGKLRAILRPGHPDLTSRAAVAGAVDALVAGNPAECPNCGELKRPHHVCASCGHYADREVVAQADEIDLDDEDAA